MCSQLTAAVVSYSQTTHARCPSSGEAIGQADELAGYDFVVKGRTETFPCSSDLLEKISTGRRFDVIVMPDRGCHL